MAHEIVYNNFEISLVVFMPNITTNHAITYTKTDVRLMESQRKGVKKGWDQLYRFLFYQSVRLV